MKNHSKPDKSNHNYRHGHACGGVVSGEYNSWKMMLNRCRNPNGANWDRYGGRGITVCDRWFDFANFIEDMGVRPTPRHTIDRIDSNGPYCKENCRWATRSEQSQNKSNLLMYQFRGETLRAREIARRTGVNYNTFRQRLQRGWSLERAAVPFGKEV